MDINTKRKDSGITLITLAVTIIVLLILLGVTTTSGVNSLKLSKYTKFNEELKIMQAQVDQLYEKYKDDDVINIGKDITDEYKESAEEAFSAVGETDQDGYKIFDRDVIDELDIQGITGEFIVNIKKRKVLSLMGLEYNGQVYYSLTQ